MGQVLAVPHLKSSRSSALAPVTGAEYPVYPNKMDVILLAYNLMDRQVHNSWLNFSITTSVCLHKAYHEGSQVLA